MLKIYALDYYRLSNARHSALMDFVLRAVDEFSIVKDLFPNAVEQFRAAVKNLHQSRRPVLRPLQSAKILSADAERINWFRMLRDMAKLKLRSSEKAIVEAAQLIVDVANAAGGSRINSLPVASRTGALHIFIMRVEDFCMEQLQLLGLQEYFDKLRDANHEFLEMDSERNYSDAEHGKNAVKRARKKCDFALKTLVSMVNDKIRLGEGADLEPFVKILNVEIDFERISLGQGPGDRKPRRRKKKGEEAVVEVVDVAEVAEVD